jgi:hypothetical protein
MTAEAFDAFVSGDEPPKPEASPDEPEESFDDETLIEDSTAEDDLAILSREELLAIARQVRSDASHQKMLRAVDQRAKWEAEASRFFPLSDPAGIQALSRRNFLKQAREQHEARKPLVEEWLKQSGRRVITDEEREAALEGERLAYKAELAAAWGRPSVGVAPVHGPEYARPSDSEAKHRIHERGLGKFIADQLKDEPQ